MNCSLCNTNVSKYTCPDCRIPYCSLNCWKIHIDKKCEKYVEEIKVQESTLENYSFRTDDTIPRENLKLLKYNENVKTTLHNLHVRNILEIVDKSKNPVASLKIAMLEPIFVEFVEECLKVVEPVDEKESGYGSLKTI